MFWKNVLKINILANFLVFYLFSHLANLVSQILYQNFRRLYLSQMWEMDGMELTTGGPNTHDDPHETGAARKAARPLLFQKNPFRNYQKIQNFLFL